MHMFFILSNVEFQIKFHSFWNTQIFTTITTSQIAFLVKSKRLRFFTIFVKIASLIYRLRPFILTKFAVSQPKSNLSCYYVIFS